MAIDRADLHAHTTVSDGTRTPAEVVQLAAEKGLAAVAITDHDTMGGVEEALAEGARLNITVVPGIEISTSASGKDIHILGYYADWRDAKWQQRLELLGTGRGRRNEQIVEALRKHGIPITMNEVIAAAGRMEGRKSIGRPHIAAVLVGKGVVSTISEAFEQWIGSGKPGYANLPKVSPFEAVEWIREAGGTSVIAHPGLYHDDKLVEEIILHGVNGIEVFHSDHTAEDEARYAALARRYGLLETAGSDYHGERQGVVFHGDLGSRTVDVKLLEQLQIASRTDSQ
ncbi:PHP domain-containing protein [Paenibacillus sp. GCM10012307]|uniref:PHP domain-containing protein n=1 Tax=Paenibacillus roseus TaxID=2798579 RepID=A0A934MSI1_9BACL|nr:PHP domain-containing protein [Paenibacillus roseus]MBJ6363294.1 PHP domain-containing protein [Paenibacillus roseus]